MALKLTVTSPEGIEMIDAVHVVEDVCVAVTGDVRFLLKSYASLEEDQAFEAHTFNAPHDAGNEDIEQQAYAYVKGLSNFENAVEI